MSLTRRERGLPPLVSVRSGTHEASYQAFPVPAGLAPEPLLSFMPHWRPTRRPGMPTPAEQIQALINRRESEIAELRALQLKYPLPPDSPANTEPPVEPAA